MGSPYVGEIRIFAGNYEPAGWAYCDGRPLPISENDVLFTLIGTTYGGDGETTFNLPNLCGRIPLHQGTAPSGTTYQIGEMAGVEQVTLTTQQIPNHNHAVAATQNAGTTGSSTPSVGAHLGGGTARTYTDDTTGANTVAMNAGALAPTGGSQPHENMQPYLCLNYIISLYGIFPSQN
jgi:microcystin-dependent protein